MPPYSRGRRGAHGNPYRPKYNEPRFNYGDDGGGYVSGDLDETLRSFEGKSYGAYKQLFGAVFEVPVAEGGVTVHFDSIQSDPFAPPSRLRFRVAQPVGPTFLEPQCRLMAFQDFLTRRLNVLINSKVSAGMVAPGIKGRSQWHSSKGCKLIMYRPSQNVLMRSSVIAGPEWIEARMKFQLPARGRTIEGHRCADLLCRTAIKVIHEGLYVVDFSEIEMRGLHEYIRCVQNQELLRETLSSHNLVAFVPNGACLPRKSGFDDVPMHLPIIIKEEADDAETEMVENDTKPDATNVQLFQSPPSLEVELPLSDGTKIRGMGIKSGVTIITGGGYHGKSTLLDALQYGIYSKIPGDGREFVTTLPCAVKIQAEEGRQIRSLDISPFIKHLPLSLNVKDFDTFNASGSTSQAANILEALECRSRLLLIDEDTSATNLMQRDAVMDQVVDPSMEPIQSLLTLARSMYDDHGISCIIVVGSCGAFFGIAHCVIQMHEFVARDITARAKSVTTELPLLNPFPLITQKRKVGRVSLSIDSKPRPRWSRHVLVRGEEVLLCLDKLPQIIEDGQFEAILQFFQEAASVGGVDDVTVVAEQGTAAILRRCFATTNKFNGDVAVVPPLLMNAALNRFKFVKIHQSA